MIDLHTHSTFSDGSLTPEALVALARAEGLSALALTDHDTTDGIPRLLAACREPGAAPVEGLAGVEISADVPRGTLHILGYLVNPGEPTLQTALRRIREGRDLRNHAIVERLNGLGFALTWEEVAAYAGEDVVGRPHFAAALVAKGYVRTRQEAFDRYLMKGKPAYVSRFRFGPEDSIAAVVKAGGVPVLAHPVTLELGPAELRQRLIELRAAGLQGVEAYYSEHTEPMIRQYLALTRELGLVASGGSDFHGDANPQIRLGRGFGGLRVPDDLVAQLRSRVPA